MGSNAVCPAQSANTDNDGTVSLLEGLPFYGPILESLTPFPTTSTEVYNQTFTVNTSDPAKNVLPLENREIVLHGMTVAAGQDMFNNNGAAGYDPSLSYCLRTHKSNKRFGNGTRDKGLTLVLEHLSAYLATEQVHTIM